MQKGVAFNQLGGKSQKVPSDRILDLCSAFLPPQFEAGASEMGSGDMLSFQVGQGMSLWACPRTEGGIK